jgi:hypothetical protein
MKTATKKKNDETQKNGRKMPEKSKGKCFKMVVCRRIDDTTAMKSSVLDVDRII